MIRDLHLTLTNMRVYVGDHPIAGAAIQRSYESLTRILENRAELTLGVVDDRLVADGTPLDGSDALVAKFLAEFKKRDIEGLVFHPGISQQEFRTFLRCLNEEAKGALRERLKDQGVSHVVVNEFKYEKKSDSSIEADGLVEAIIAAFLTGKTPGFQESEEHFLSPLKERPGEIGRLINAGLETMRKRGDDEGELDRAVSRAVDQVGCLLESRPEGFRGYVNVMAQIILSLSPEAQSGLYRSKTAEENHPRDRVDAFVMEFTDREVIRLISNVYRGGIRTPQMLLRVTERVLPTQERRSRIVSDLGRELMKSGMQKPVWETLRDEILWDSYALPQRVDCLASRPKWGRHEIERIKQLGQNLAENKNRKEARKLLGCLFAALESEDPQVRLMVARYHGQFYRMISGSFTNADFYFFQKMVGRLKRETDQRVKESILISLSAILREEILKSNLHNTAKAVFTLSKMGDLEQLIKLSGTLLSQDVFDRIITALSRTDKSDEASLLLKLFGRTALEPVLSAIEKEEDRHARERLMSVVRSMRTEATREIIRRLRDNRAHVVQTALSLLGEIGETRAPLNLLVGSVHHDDIRVKEEAIRTLGKLKMKGATRVLCRLLRDKDEEIRILALKNLGEVGDKMAVPDILPFLKRKKLIGHKSHAELKTAIKALGRIGDPQSIPPLLDLFKSKGFLIRTDLAVRRTVLEALGAIRAPELREVLESVVEKDKDLELRETAQKSLVNLRNGNQKFGPDAIW
jgi:HEAT repeat protein